jgi:hypothetical protein
MPARAKRADDRAAAHWRRLGLLAGAPECVIKAAHRYLIEIHHPDRGGSVETAQQVNVAADEVRGLGRPANEYVAANYAGEPWHVLGLMANADQALVERVAKALRQEVKATPRLAERVGWAAANFGQADGHRVPRPVSQPRRRAAPDPVRPRTPAVAGRPEGLVEKIDFGSVAWGQAISRDLRLTWREHAPYRVLAQAAPPLSVTVVESKALTGRFIVSVSIDWASEELARAPSMRGYMLDSMLEFRWASGGEATVRVRGVLLSPTTVTADRDALDLGVVTLGTRVRAQLILESTAKTEVAIETPPWLVRVDGAGDRIEGPARLEANAAMRITFSVDWAPIRERGASSLAAGRAVRPTGVVRVRWADQVLEVPATIVVEARG